MSSTLRRTRTKPIKLAGTHTGATQQNGLNRDRADNNEHEAIASTKGGGEVAAARINILRLKSKCQLLDCGMDRLHAHKHTTAACEQADAWHGGSTPCDAA